MDDARLDLGDRDGAVAQDALVEDVDVEEVGIPVRTVEEGPPEDEAVGADGGEGVAREAQLQPVAAILLGDVEAGPAVREDAGAVVVPREEAEGIVHPEEGEIAGEGGVLRAHRVGNGFGREDVGIREGDEHPREPGGIGQDVVRIDEGDEFAVRGLDAGGLAGFAGAERVGGDDVDAGGTGDRDGAVGRPGVRDDDFVVRARQRLRGDRRQARGQGLF